MKILTVALCLFFVFAGNALSAQDSGAKASNQSKGEQAAAVDCSAVDDAKITAGVKDRLSKSNSLKDAGIEVQTKDAVVTLTGTVKTSGLKGVATRLTKRVDCVKKVDNQLKYEQGPAKRKESKDAKPTGGQS